MVKGPRNPESRFCRQVINNGFNRWYEAPVFGFEDHTHQTNQLQTQSRRHNPPPAFVHEKQVCLKFNGKNDGLGFSPAQFRFK